MRSHRGVTIVAPERERDGRYGLRGGVRGEGRRERGGGGRGGGVRERACACGCLFSFGRKSWAAIGRGPFLFLVAFLLACLSACLLCWLCLRAGLPACCLCCFLMRGEGGEGEDGGE